MAVADSIFTWKLVDQKPASIETVTAREHYAFQDGQPVFKFAVKGMADVSAELLERNNLTGDDISWLVPHQANLRIIDATANRIGLPKEKVMINIQKFGNTTAGTIPLCLWEWENQLKKRRQYRSRCIRWRFYLGSHTG